MTAVGVFGQCFDQRDAVTVGQLHIRQAQVEGFVVQ
jgi:hypothetical protein